MGRDLELYLIPVAKNSTWNLPKRRIAEAHGTLNLWGLEPSLDGGKKFHLGGEDMIYH